MPPRKSPEYVGTEEDRTCIICKQYLYLSAVSCCCRPLTFVCLEHWEHICECKSSRLRLLYRYSLAELYELLHTMDKHSSDESLQNKNLRSQISISHQLSGLTKKVKGGHISLAQLTEQWLSRSFEVFHSPYCCDAYATQLKEAEQFLWAGIEVDPVRNVVKDLIVAQKWAEGMRDCLFRIQNWSSCRDLERVHMESINELLNVQPVPCNEPGHIKLKVIVIWCLASTFILSSSLIEFF
uniref:Transcription factor n=1 Tax=Rhizophora mucronata TaxID=61149 RepID=A0A2P2MIT6_RHIMU